MGLQDMSLDQLENEITELAGHINAATCRWLLLVGELDRREGWLEWGCKSCAHWLSLRCGIGLTAARQQVKVARALPQLPQIRGSFSRGELSYSQVRALTRGHPGHRGGPARGGTARHAQLEALVRSYRGVLARELGPVNDAYRNRFVIYAHEDDGRWCRTPGCQRRRGARPRRPGSGDGSACDDAPKTIPRNRCAPARPTGSCGWRKRSCIRPHAGFGRLSCRSWWCTSTRPRRRRRGRRLPRGWRAPLHPETARRLGCDSSVVRILERDGRPLPWAAGREPSRGSRGPLGSRDGGCRFPGCTEQRFVDAHHIQHWAHGGRSELGNLVQLCRRHHRLLHEGGYTLERGSARRLVFRWPTGGRSAAVGACGATSASLATEPGSKSTPRRHSAPVRGQVRSRVRGRRDRGSGFALRRRRSCPTRRDRRQPRAASPAEA